MSLLDKLFGKKNSPEPNNIQKQLSQIEKQLSCFLPQTFKQLLIKYPEKELILDLMDERYRILHSLCYNMKFKYDDDIVAKSSDLGDTYDYPEDPDFIKIPFAKSLTGDGYKYLYFLAKKGTVASEQIYIRDTDAPNTSRIKIAENLQFIRGHETIKSNEIIISNKQQKFSDFESLINLPDKMTRMKFEGMTRPNNEKRIETLNIDLHAKICEFTDPSENFTNFYVDMTLVTADSISFYNIPYEVDIVGLRYNVENNMNYRIFYHKFIAIVDALRVVMLQDKVDKEAALNLVNQLDWSTVAGQDFVQIDYYRE